MNRVAADGIHKSVFSANAPRPTPGKIMFQRFRFAQSAMGRLHDAFHKKLDFSRSLGFVLFEIELILAGFW